MIRKFLKKFPPLILALTVLVLGLQNTVFAAYTSDKILQLGDYILSSTIDSDTGKKTINFDFSTTCLGNYRSYVWRDNVLEFTNTAPSMGYDTTPNEWTSVTFRSFPLGGKIFYRQPLYAGYIGYVFDVRDVTLGTDAHYHSEWTIDVTYSGNTLNWVAIAGFYMYDADGNYFSRTFGQESYVLTSGGRFTVNFDLTGSNYANGEVCYIVPYFEFTVNTNSGEPTTSPLTVSWSNVDCGMSIDLDLVAENSALQHAIYDKLDDLNDKQQQTNDKLDTIISGSPEQNVVADQAGQNMNDAVSRGDAVIEDVGSMNKPDPESAVPDVVDQIPSGSVVALTGVISPWFENNVFIRYLTLTCGIMFVSYVLFGKKR